MIRVGAVNIDTSHPMGFAESMRKDGRMQYVGVYNDSFRSDEEVSGFIARYGLEKRCESLEELAGMCDIGFIQGCDWDEHLRCAKPFIEAGKPVFIDKPLVGNLADLKAARELVRSGAVILGSSSVRYAYELRELLDTPVAERGEIVTVYGTSGVDEFNYGIHIVEAIGALLGPGAQSVRYIGRGEADGSYTGSYHVRYSAGKNAIYTLMTGVWQPFCLTVMTTKTSYAMKLDSSRLYDALIGELCDRMEGKPNHLAGIDELLESVAIALAAAASREQGGAEVALSGLSEAGPRYDGPEFKRGYAAAAGKLYAL